MYLLILKYTDWKVGIVRYIFVHIMNTERLIECVRRHSFLYDIYHKEYKNVNLKTTIWDLIGRELNQSGEAVKCKWKSIRDGYVKYKKQSKAASASGKKIINYLWSSHLSFLDNYRPPSSYVVNDPSPSSSSFTQQPREYEVSHDQVTEPLSSNISPLITSLEVQTEPQIASTSREKLKESRKIKREVNHVDEVLKHLNKKKRKVDGIDHLFLSYAETFKKFPPKEQAILKLKLAKLFSNTELKLLKNVEESRVSSASPAHSSSSDDDTLHELIDNVQPAQFCTDIKKEE